MAASIPSVEPASARAGDTWQWTRDLGDYPATDWTVTYTFWTATAAFSAVASADGTTHSISLPPATTAAYAAGRYQWTARVSDGTDVFTVGSGTLQVLPAVGAAMDTRSHARIMLDALNAVLESRATDGDIDVVRTAVGDRATDWDPNTLVKLRQQYASAVVAEEDAARIARGEQSARFVGVRFTG
jgi:hypothetical protein